MFTEAAPPKARHAPADAWRTYPYAAAPGDPEMVFPAAEGYQGDATDTYYASGILEGERSGRRYAFLAIFVKIRRVARVIAADLHIFALFDLDAGGYTTFASYDLPPWRWLRRRRLTVARGSLDVAWDSPTWTARLGARRDASGALAPFAYALDVRGRDSRGAPIALSLRADATKPPQPVGGPEHGGVITVMGQPATHSYYQALSYAGSLRWGAADEPVSGAIGWLDRQWFPEYAGAYAGALSDRYGHQWSQLSLDNGWELSLWQHFARAERNREVPFSGVTITDPDGRTSFTAGYQVDVLSYCRDDGPVVPLLAPLQGALGARAAVRYFFDAYRLRVPALDLDVTSTPLAPAPAHRMPVDYLSGPTLLAGVMGGREVRGYGFNERTLPLSQPWELQAVLYDSLRHAAGAQQIADLAAAVGTLIDTGHAGEARAALSAQLRPAVAALQTPQRDHLVRICDDLAAVLPA